MLVRQAHEIELVYKSGRTKLPGDYQSNIMEVCLSEGIIFNGFIGEWRGNRTKLHLQCTNGHTFTPRIDSFNSGRRCPKCAYTKITKEDYLQRFKPIFYRENITFNGFIGEWKGKLTRLNLQCNKGHKFTPTIDTFNSGCRCPECKADKLKELKSITKEDYLQRLKPIFGKENIKFSGFIGDWVGNKTKLNLQCCNGHKFTPTITGFESGNRCSKCAKYGYVPSRQGTFYVQKLLNNGLFFGVKFGITNRTTKDRIKAQSAKSKFDHEIFYELTLQDGQKILELENKIKEAMKGKTSYISKEDMPDGYTETVAPSELSTIMYIVKSFEKELTC